MKRFMVYHKDLAKVFQPIEQGTEKSASKISSEIKNLKEEVQPKNEKTEPTNKALEYYFNAFDQTKLDQYFGVYKDKGMYMMGNKEIVIDDKNNISLDNGAVVYEYTGAL